MNFQLDPPSGYADSYLDIKFTVKFEYADRVEILLINETTHSNIEILGMTNGYIINEIKGVVDNNIFAEGFINIFNKDKMNKKLESYTSVSIKCKVKFYRGNNITEEMETIDFYNQSKSLDSSIVPFDINIINSVVDIRKNQPLKIQITCDSVQHYELCIKNENSPYSFTFEVYTRKGIIEISIPVAILWYDLKLYRVKTSNFFIYWVKFEGLDYSKYINRKYISINNSKIAFLYQDKFKIMPQSRFGPIEKLNKDFVLSDKYFVHTAKKYSGFGSIHENIGYRRLSYITRFFHESQSIQKIDNSIKSFNITHRDKILESKQAIRSQEIREDRRNVIQSFPVPPQKEFLESSFHLYSKTNTQSTVSHTTRESKGGCGCSRKK